MPVREIQPTRSELLEVTRKIKLTQNGHKILKLKRDGLILEFFKILDQAKDLRLEITRRYKDASEKIAIASAVDGVIAVRSASYALTGHPEIQLRSRNLMGVVVPDIKSNKIVAPLPERGYVLLFSEQDSARPYRWCPTNPSGFFSLRNIRAGTYVLNVRRLGYRPVQEQISISPALSLKRDVALIEEEFHHPEITVEGHRSAFSVSEGISRGIYIRATPSDHNQYLLEGARIYTRSTWAA